MLRATLADELLRLAQGQTPAIARVRVAPSVTSAGSDRIKVESSARASSGPVLPRPPSLQLLLARREQRGVYGLDDVDEHVIRHASKVAARLKVSGNAKGRKYNWTSGSVIRREPVFTRGRRWKGRVWGAALLEARTAWRRRFGDGPQVGTSGRGRRRERAHRAPSRRGARVGRESTGVGILTSSLGIHFATVDAHPWSRGARRSHAPHPRSHPNPPRHPTPTTISHG